jgi:hypothetical protein
MSFRFITKSIHAYLIDYPVAIVLIAAPFYRSILAVTAAVISPASSQPSLFIIRDEAAAYLDIWWRRIVAVPVFVLKLGQSGPVAMWLVCRSAHGALFK